MADDKKTKADKSAGATGSVADNNAKKALNRRDYLRNAGLTAAGAGAASIGFPTIARAQNKTYKLKLQSNWTGIGIEAQDKAAQLFVDRVKKLSGGRIEVTNFNAEVLLGIGETFRGVGSGVADLAVTSSIYHRGIVPVGEFLWAVPFFPITTLEFYEHDLPLHGRQGVVAGGLQAAQRRAPELHDLGRVGRHGVDPSGRKVCRLQRHEGARVRHLGRLARAQRRVDRHRARAARSTPRSRPRSSTLRRSDHRMPGPA